jgi:hypothetical protein
MTFALAYEHRPVPPLPGGGGGEGDFVLVLMVVQARTGLRSIRLALVPLFKSYVGEWYLSLNRFLRGRVPCLYKSKAGIIFDRQVADEGRCFGRSPAECRNLAGLSQKIQLWHMKLGKMTYLSAATSWLKNTQQI